MGRARWPVPTDRRWRCWTEARSQEAYPVSATVDKASSQAFSTGHNHAHTSLGVWGGPEPLAGIFSSHSAAQRLGVGEGGAASG